MRKNIVYISIFLLVIILVMSLVSIVNYRENEVAMNFEINRLADENSALLAEIEILTENNNTLKKENNSLTEEKNALLAEIEALTENNNILIEKNIDLFDIEESYNLIGKSIDEIIDIYGTDFENVHEGVEGVYHGLHYKQLGVIFATSNNIVEAIYLDDSASIKGTYLDLTIYDVQDILGENEIQSIMTEGQEYWLFYEYDNYTIQFRTMESLNNKLEDISIVLPGKHFGHWQ